MSTFTPNLNLEEPALGADVNSWNVPLNGNFTIIDQAITGVTVITLSNANVVLTNVQSAYRIIFFTGVLTASVTVTLTVTGEFAFCNVTTGAFTITIKGSSGDTGIVIPQGGMFNDLACFNNGAINVMKNTDAASVAGRQGNVVLAVADVSGAAPLASPALTGTPTVPTVTTGVSSTTAANTANVLNNIAAQIAAEGAFTPTGRLTLTTAVPVLSGAVSGASTIIYTPYIGSQIPMWNGAAWTPQSFAEISQALSDTTHSPAAAVANSLYDLFVWVNAGVVTLSRGPVWTNATTRALALSRVGGILTNSSLITNGPAAGFGAYVGTIATDPGAATVTFNPTPAAAAGGPTGGAWIGLWNYYNRVNVSAFAQDNTATWTYGTATWRQADAGTGNKITFLTGFAEDSVSAIYQSQFTGTNVLFAIGIGLDSITVPSIANYAGGTSNFDVSVKYSTSPVIGQHYLSAMEVGNGTSTATISGVTSGLGTAAQITQLDAQLRY